MFTVRDDTAITKATRRRSVSYGAALGILGGIGCASGTIVVSLLGGASQGAFLRSLTPYLIGLTSIAMIAWITWTTIRDDHSLPHWLRAVAVRGTLAALVYGVSLLAATSLRVVV